MIDGCLARGMRRRLQLGAAFFSVALVGLAGDGESPGVVGGNVWETIQRGGAIMYVILAASIFGLAFILETAFRLRSGAILSNATIRQLRASATPDARRELLRGEPRTAMQRILRAGDRWRHGTPEQIQAAIEESVDALAWTYRRAARPVGIIANVTPLLGLLGTVIGIIQAFDAVAREGALGDPSALAGGIAKALLTTGFGLIVAIPMLLAFHYLIGTMETRLHRCEELAKELLILPPAAARQDGGDDEGAGENQANGEAGMSVSAGGAERDTGSGESANGASAT